jgi:hypothetical protein
MTVWHPIEPVVIESIWDALRIAAVDVAPGGEPSDSETARLHARRGQLRDQVRGGRGPTGHEWDTRRRGETTPLLLRRLPARRGPLNLQGCRARDSRPMEPLPGRMKTWPRRARVRGQRNPFRRQWLTSVGADALRLSELDAHDPARPRPLRSRRLGQPHPRDRDLLAALPDDGSPIFIDDF